MQGVSGQIPTANRKIVFSFFVKVPKLNRGKYSVLVFFYWSTMDKLKFTDRSEANGGSVLEKSQISPRTIRVREGLKKIVKLSTKCVKFDLLNIKQILFDMGTLTLVRCSYLGALTLPGRGYRFRGLEGGGLNQPPPLEINEGVVSDPRLLYRSLT